MRQEGNLRPGIGRIRGLFGFMFLLPTNLIILIVKNNINKQKSELLKIITINRSLNF